MQEKIIVAVDAMGGDNAPLEMIKGSVDAVNQNPQIRVILVGQEEKISPILSQFTYPKDQIGIRNATEVISTEETPVLAIRKKKDSSIVVGERMVKEKEADAFVSAGSTGAVLAGASLITGRLKGIERTPLGTLIPTAKGVALLADSGANVDCKASYLVQFAKMGSIYMEHVMGVKNPRVGLVNIGVEEEKGNSLVKEAHELLKNCQDIHFIGNIEAREIPNAGADVVVCDGFVGNVILKMYEGVGGVLIKKIKETLTSSLTAKIGALLIKSALKETLKSFDATEYGGAPMLGLNGLVVKTHGNAKAQEVRNSILQCLTFQEQHINDKIKEFLDQERRIKDGI